MLPFLSSNSDLCAVIASLERFSHRAAWYHAELSKRQDKRAQM